MAVVLGGLMAAVGGPWAVVATLLLIVGVGAGMAGGQEQR
jgi:hypothetical protein